MSEETALITGEKVWKQGSNIRDVISLGKLLRKGDEPEEIEGLVKTLAKYTNDADANLNPLSFKRSTLDCNTVKSLSINTKN